MKKLSYITLLSVVLLLMVSCKKDMNNTDNLNKSIGHHPEAHVLKAPYLIYNNDPTTMCIAVHTSHEVDGGGWPNKKKVEVQWKYEHESDYHGYYEMDHHEFHIPDEYGQDHENYIVWQMKYAKGHFHPDSHIDYEVRVTYNIEGQVKHYYGSFNTPDPNATTLSFYAISDTQEDAATKSSEYKGGPTYYRDVMETILEDVSVNYAERATILLHCGDFNFNSPREYYHPQDSPWNKEFFGTTSNNEGQIPRDDVTRLLARIPVMGTIGNHDWIWDSNSSRNSCRDYVAAFPYDMYMEHHSDFSIGDVCKHDWAYKKKPELLYYSFDYGPAHFISLSSYPSSKNDHSSCFGNDSEQVAWLEYDLARTDKEWIFVFTHIPIIDGHGGPHNPPVFDACEPLFQLYGVDAVLQGHEHFYMKRHYNGIPYLVLGGGGAFLMLWNQPNAEVYVNKKWFFTRFDILNSDSCQVLVTERSGSPVLGDIDNFYIYNRQRKK